MVEIKTILLHLLPYIPFLSAAVIKVPGTPEISGIGAVATRLLEAGIVGGIIMYANLQVMEQKLTSIEKNIDRYEVYDAGYRATLKELSARINRLDNQVTGLNTTVGIHHK